MVNEDQFLVGILARALRVQRTSLPQTKMRYGQERNFFFAVADGVSGQQGGEEASALAIDLIEQFLLEPSRSTFDRNGSPKKALLKDLETAFLLADAAICREGKRHPPLEGMGTTLTVAFLHQADLYLAHVGDSRCYLFRKGQLHRLTRDHTVAEEMVRKGRLSLGKAKQHWLRHMITNVLGGPEPGVQPELRQVRLETGDIALLCTDGLTDGVPDDLIALVLAAEPDPARACQRLIDQANRRGGKDNITVVVARFDPPTR
jgi:protein phosphatase